MCLELYQGEHPILWNTTTWHLLMGQNIAFVFSWVIWNATLSILAGDACRLKLNQTVFPFCIYSCPEICPPFGRCTLIWNSVWKLIRIFLFMCIGRMLYEWHGVSWLIKRIPGSFCKASHSQLVCYFPSYIFVSSQITKFIWHRHLSLVPLLFLGLPVVLQRKPKCQSWKKKRP
jgi:hypothetical protein